jgi:hypothetical protein
VTLVEEGLAAMRGCWRLIRRDPLADEEFNLTIDGFWRSFAMVLPLLVLVYPLFLSDHQLRVELAAQEGQEPPVLKLGLDYTYLLVGVVVWPFVAALLAWLLGTGQTYVRYMIIYNWMALPATLLAVIPHLIHLANGTMMPALILAQVVFLLVLYVSWYVAKAGLQTTAPVAFAFLAADYALTYGLNALIR